MLFVKQRTSVSEPPFGGLKVTYAIPHWKDSCRFPTGCNWTFLLSLTAEALPVKNTSKSAFDEGVGQFEVNIRLKGYVYHKHLYTIR